MIKWLGAMLTVICSILLGSNALIHSRQRIRALRSLADTMERMRLRISEFYTPMPELLENLAAESEQPAAEFFSAAFCHMAKRNMPFSPAWELAIKETEALCLLPEEQQVLMALGSVLGRCSAEEQSEAILRAEKRLQVFLELEEKERMKQGKVTAALGTGAGVMLVILLL